LPDSDDFLVYVNENDTLVRIVTGVTSRTRKGFNDGLVTWCWVPESSFPLGPIVGKERAYWLGTSKGLDS
jgi:hypothetical protein